MNKITCTLLVFLISIVASAGAPGGGIPEGYETTIGGLPATKIDSKLLDFRCKVTVTQQVENSSNYIRTELEMIKEVAMPWHGQHSPVELEIGFTRREFGALADYKVKLEGIIEFGVMAKLNATLEEKLENKSFTETANNFGYNHQTSGEFSIGTDATSNKMDRVLYYKCTLL